MSVWTTSVFNDLMLMGDFNVHYIVLPSATTTRFLDTMDSMDMSGVTQWVGNRVESSDEQTHYWPSHYKEYLQIAYSCQRSDHTSHHSVTFVFLNVPILEFASIFVTMHCFNNNNNYALTSDLVSAVSPDMPLKKLMPRSDSGPATLTKKFIAVVLHHHSGTPYLSASDTAPLSAQTTTDKINFNTTPYNTSA